MSIDNAKDLLDQLKNNRLDVAEIEQKISKDFFPQDLLNILATNS